MDMKNEAFLKRLLETFAQEAKEHIDNLSGGLLKLKKSDAESAKALVETLFREAHSFKGAARAVNIIEIEELCKAMEDIFSSYKQLLLKIPDPLIEVMLECNDMLTLLSTANENERRDLKPQVQERIEALRKSMQAQSGANNMSPQQPCEAHPSEATNTKEDIKEPELKAKEPQQLPIPTDISKEPEIKTEETLRIPVKKLSAIMQQSEEMLFAKMVSKRHVEDLLRIEGEIKELITMVQSANIEMILERLTTLKSAISGALKQTKGDSREIRMMVNHLIADMKEALMLPFSALFSTLPKIVHDMAKSVGKDINLSVIGAEMEIDRRISEQMHDPLLHLLRNSIDHGIEKSGTITLTLTQKSASKVELSVADDGSGIDSQKIRQSSVQKGVITQSEADTLDEESALNLIFKSGVSTAKVVTDLSGRGLGLAIVLEKAEQLGGGVHVQNNKEKGCTFTILLPLTMTTFRGVVTSLGAHKYIFASERIARVMTIAKESIKNIEGKKMVVYEHHVVPFYHLSAVLELPFTENESEEIAVVVITSANEMLAIGVDAIEYEEEVMVKSLGTQLLRVHAISGASLLASDVPALILNIFDIFKSVGSISLKTVASKEETIKKKSKILVVDDSPTTLALLQNILEMVGYEVAVAVNGLQAFEMLKKESFDLVISDVDMPKMNGFELTEAIRADSRMSELSVILVTSLESQEDKERGMQAGANAYLIKSAFDRNNLIENVQRLMN
jgi:two-component system chemotaxis sensor kinase CheA